MNPSESDPIVHGEPSGFDSRNCVNFVFEISGDEMRWEPTPPHIRAALLAERERIARWQKLLDQEKDKEKPS